MLIFVYMYTTLKVSGLVHYFPLKLDQKFGL